MGKPAQARSPTREEFFGPNRKLFRATAPGRLDVMGGVADYSGSLVLQYPLGCTTTATVALRDDRKFRVCSQSDALDAENHLVTARIPGRFSYRRIAEQFDSKGAWAAYVVGCAAVLIKEKRVNCSGADIWIDSDVPVGRGVSASAALETAVMTALVKALGVKLTKTELPGLCQLAENEVALAPCGIMDQTVSYLGRAGSLLPILCQPQKVGDSIPLPKGTHLVGIDSGVTHAVSGSAYADARAAAFMGYEIIRQDLGQKRPFDGYLANLSVSDFEDQFADKLPEEYSGRSFQNRFGTTVDPVSVIVPSRRYKIQAATRHPVYEHARVTMVRHYFEALNNGCLTGRQREDALATIGEAMYQSHNSYTRIGLGHTKTTQVVRAAKRFGIGRGIYGGRITGGGSGGTVCLFVKGRRGLQAAREIAQESTGVNKILHSTSDGARWRSR